MDSEMFELFYNISPFYTLWNKITWMTDLCLPCYYSNLVYMIEKLRNKTGFKVDKNVVNYIPVQ